MSRAATDAKPGVVQMEAVASCPVCESEDRFELFATHDWLYGGPGEFNLAQCNECGVAYLRLRPDASSLRLYYPDNDYYAYQPGGSHALFSRAGVLASMWYFVKRSVLAHRHNYKHLGGSRAIAALASTPATRWLTNRVTFQLAALLHPFVEGGKLLEVGCGSGRYLDLMRALGWKKVVGVDLGEKAVEHARDNLELEVYCGELRDAPLEPESFDAVSLSHTLEHVADPVAFLRDIRRVMKPGGRLAIIVPNVESFASRKYRNYWLALDPPRHLVNFNLRGLAIALERAGLSIETLTTTPRGGYEVLLFSHSRKAGDDRSVYADSGHRFSVSRRARAFFLSLIERAQCAAGLPAGEELLAVAVRPR